MKNNLLFEIGVEEIPARFIEPAISQIKENFERLFNEYGIEFSDLKVFATPRRLCIVAKVSDEQVLEEKLIWGPPAHVAFDENGNPKQPALAFAKSQGVEIKDLQIKPKGKGKYVCAVIKQKGKNTEEVLPEILRALFLSLSFPKMMRWASGYLKFVRPVRWFLALYKDEIVHFDIDGISSDNKTYGHRFFAEAPIEVLKIEEYEKLLQDAFVIVDQNKRRQIIIEQGNRIAETINTAVLWNDELLQEVTYLVEFPNAVLCSFSEIYLSLPEELLITVMKDHQRYFAVVDSSGKLKNYFIVISNTVAENEQTIRKGAERVIKARFEDAKFYYEEDIKKGIDRLLDATKGIIYHEKLGSLYDKSLRIVNIAHRVAKIILPEKIEIVKTAAKYCKADLASGVVSEFPELQGIMGGYYAASAGFPQEVCIAIKEHYLPKTVTDKIPSTDVGAILSIADKLDHIASFFYLGEIPSGTEDPFGLRRSANSVIALLAKRHYPLSIREVVDFAEDFGNRELKRQVEEFFAQRIESWLEILGYSVNMIKTVEDFILDCPVFEIAMRLDAVKRFMQQPQFESFFLAVKRVSNIIKNFKIYELNSELLLQKEEKALYDEMQKKKEDLKSYLDEKKFFEALCHLDNLTSVINDFFDRVLVMDKDENIKNNRIALLQELSNILKSVADLSKLY